MVAESAGGSERAKRAFSSGGGRAATVSRHVHDPGELDVVAGRADRDLERAFLQHPLVRRGVPPVWASPREWEWGRHNRITGFPTITPESTRLSFPLESCARQCVNTVCSAVGLDPHTGSEFSARLCGLGSGLVLLSHCCSVRIASAPPAPHVESQRSASVKLTACGPPEATRAGAARRGTRGRAQETVGTLAMRSGVGPLVLAMRVRDV